MCRCPSCFSLFFVQVYHRFISYIIDVFYALFSKCRCAIRESGNKTHFLWNYSHQIFSFQLKFSPKKVNSNSIKHPSIYTCTQLSIDGRREEKKSRKKTFRQLNICVLSQARAMLTVALEWKEKKNCFNENKVYLGKFMAFPWHYRLSFCRSNHASLLLNNVIFSSHSLSFFWCWHHLCGLCRTLLKCWTEQASVFYIKMCVESDRERMNLAKKI